MGAGKSCAGQTAVPTECGAALPAGVQHTRFTISLLWNTARAHTHARTHTHTHTHAHTQVRTYAHAHMQVRTHVHMSTRILTHTHARVSDCECKCLSVSVCARTHHAQSLAQVITHTHTHVRSNECICVHVVTTDAHTRANMCFRGCFTHTIAHMRPGESVCGHSLKQIYAFVGLDTLTFLPHSTMHHHPPPTAHTRLRLQMNLKSSPKRRSTTHPMHL